jgi:hypothetical protein
MGLLSTLGGIAGSVFGGPIGGAIGSALGGAIDGRGAVKDASRAQQQAAQGGIEEQSRQFDEVTKLLSPFTKAGETALGGLQPYAQAGAGALEQQMALLGLAPQSQVRTGGSGVAGMIANAASGAFGGNQMQFVGGEAGQSAQQQAIAALQASPQFQALQQQGENAILQNASATGGLRGGNVQAALAQFRPQILSSLIDQQYSRLGGLSSMGQLTNQNIASMGQASGARQAAAGQQTAANISNLMGTQGAARAGGILGQQSALSGGINQAFGAIQGAGGFGNLFGGRSGFQGGGQVNPISGEFMGSLEF